MLNANEGRKRTSCNALPARDNNFIIEYLSSLATVLSHYCLSAYSHMLFLEPGTRLVSLYDEYKARVITMFLYIERTSVMRAWVLNTDQCPKQSLLSTALRRLEHNKRSNPILKQLQNWIQLYPFGPWMFKQWCSALKLQQAVCSTKQSWSSIISPCIHLIRNKGAAMRGMSVAVVWIVCCNTIISRNCWTTTKRSKPLSYGQMAAATNIATQRYQMHISIFPGCPDVLSARGLWSVWHWWGTGHSQMECDSMNSYIERKSLGPMFSPRDYIVVMQVVRLNHIPYYV